jgi:hypothetical protein
MVDGKTNITCMTAFLDFRFKKCGKIRKSSGEKQAWGSHGGGCSRLPAKIITAKMNRLAHTKIC